MIILDTHVWLWWLSEPANLSRRSATAIRSTDRIGISAISCFEVATAAVRGRINLDRGILDWIELALSQPKIELLPLTPQTAVTAAQLGREFRGDPADRLIVATAIVETAILITKDLRIRRYSGVSTLW